MILALVWAAFLVSFLDRLAWANVSAFVGASLELQVAALNVFVTGFYVGYVLSNFVSGFLTDRFGGRWMLAIALVPLGTFTFLFGFTTSVAFGFVMQALMGAAAGADYAAGVKLIAAWFGRQDRGRAMGLYMTAPTLGVIITNSLVPVLLKSFDWSGIYQIFGVATIAIGVLCFVALRDRPPTRLNEPVAKQPSPPISPLVLLRNRSLLFLTIAGFGGLWGTFGFLFWVNALLIREYHMTPVDAGSIVALFGLGALVGNPFTGLVSDWLGGIRKTPIIICFLSFVVLLMIFGGFQSVTVFWLLAPVLGIAAFAYQPLMGAMVTEAAGLALAGTATGVTNACWQLGPIIVPLVVGLVFQATGSFFAAFIALAIGPLIAAVSMLFVHEARPEVVGAAASSADPA